MDSPRPEIDLEKELTCSICTELLYQPLTLLDCLHTFCGACLKEWFSWQATAAENAPTPPAPGSPIFTCPSCRASVRDTRHNATVATLLDMFLAANPHKSKSAEEKAEMNNKYKRGDRVLRRLNIPEKTPEQRRLDEAERVLIEEVRQMSLREAIAESSSRRSTPPRRSESRSRDGGSRPSREPSREPQRGTRARDARERARRQAADEETRRRAEQTAAMRQSEGRPRDEGRPRRSGSRQRSAAELSEASRRHIEHQPSLRSLISSSDIGSMDIEREIEEFARQIQEEGLLEGLDLDNLDLNNNDELSRKITEAYRRRQRQRSRTEAARRSNASGDSPHSDPATAENQTRPADSSRASSRPTSRQRPQSRSLSTTRQADDRSRPPLSSAAAHLEVEEPIRRHRRRTTSGGRSATVPVPIAEPDARPAARSQTDLTLQPHESDMPLGRPSIGGEVRSSSTPMIGTSTQAASGPANARNLPFNARANNAGLGIIQLPHSDTPPEQGSSQGKRFRRPADLMLGPAGPNFAASGGQSSPSLSSPSLASPGHQRTASQLYPEPLITCQRCRKQHIEYELHYNCSICHGGDWNICLDCYRRGKGCQHWFGFGYAAWSKWEKVRGDADGKLPEPHVLTANRYMPPKVTSGAADGRQTLTTQNPSERLQSGTFCSRCSAWTNECFWRCGICNEGDWGFCTDCVNQGRCCTHPLLPLAYSPPPRRAAAPLSSPTTSSPRSPGGSPRPPAAAAAAAAADAVPATGVFRPLAFTARCDVCQHAIPPARPRFHCYSCGGSGGGYNVCQACYGGLVAGGAVSAENGPAGWRRCPHQGAHRMAVVTGVLAESSAEGGGGGGGGGDGGGQWWRCVVRDCVGGRKLQQLEQQQQQQQRRDPASASATALLQTWYWFEGEQRRERLVSRDVAAVVDPGEGAAAGAGADGFPPDGGGGMRAVARWGWYPAAGAEDELLFPRGAEIREIDDVNGEWFHGVYMGAKGLFPAPYVQILDGQDG
ncbi:hypothetical protein QBC33DRAFT_605798 [Phialemonium atrogriseum]|uniref:RING-type domain-containing protein n=1 Tax=Phialemonium atrogriseum TaxID=1093897 RepID=A0AAJ0FNS6_9PEZI|nr:uncharacterized protein QBC33DRAFT_605798 [Phialemonium atrogriseum]KAK1769319.1 hypothetical protein QBC33DRAFT_605798 [Phialemonium atrogriseum]